MTSGQIKLKNGAPLNDRQYACSRPTIRTRRRRSSEADAMNFTDIFIQQAGAVRPCQPADPRARPARALRVCRSASIRRPRTRSSRSRTAYYGADAADGRGLHHPAARSGDRAGAGHRLPVVDQQHRRVDDHRDAAPQLRCQPRADARSTPRCASVRNQLPPQAQQPVLTVQVGADDRRDVHGLFQRRAADQQRHRLSRARRQAEARFDRGRADRRDPRRAPVRAACLARSGRAWPRTASPPATSTTRCRPTTISPRVGTTKGQMVSVDLTAATDLHSVEEFQQAGGQAAGRRDRAPRGRRQRRAGRRGLRLQRRLQRHSARCSSASRSRPTRTCSTSRSACAADVPGHPGAAAERHHAARSSTTPPSSSQRRSTKW